MSPERMYQVRESGGAGGGEARQGSGGVGARHGWGAGFRLGSCMYIQRVFASRGKSGHFCTKKASG